MANLETAIRVAVTGHAGQTDKEGLPYITHPLRLMHAVTDDAAKIVAVLHDVVEDTSVTLDDLRREGFSEAILASVARVTHQKDQPYADYVVACKPDPVAKAVKLADLTDNCSLHRCLLRPNQVARDLARIHRYVLSYKYLTDKLSEEEYRGLMKEHGELPG
jgi:(p)ppGpp synthase/HD superfamily hydrolase